MKGHRILNLIGTGLWITGFFLDISTVYPYAFYGIYGGPPILFTGILLWIKNYKHENKRLPNPISSIATILKKEGDEFGSMINFLLSHLLEIWTLIVVFWIILAFIGTTIIKNSKTFKTTVDYVKQDMSLTDKIGDIKYFGFLAGGTFSSNGTGDISFSIIGDNGTTKVWAVIENKDGQATVTEISYE